MCTSAHNAGKARAACCNAVERAAECVYAALWLRTCSHSIPARVRNCLDVPAINEKTLGTDVPILPKDYDYRDWLAPIACHE